MGMGPGKLVVRVATLPHLTRLRSSLITRQKRDATTGVRAALSSMASAAAAEALPSEVWEHVLERYHRAQASSASSMTETREELVRDEAYGVTYVLRVAAALRDKPKGPAGGKAQREWRNPFLPYEEDLWVQHLSETHTLLLNKYNIVPHHCLVVTRRFEAQEDPLNDADFAATWAALQAPPKGALAFYNSGPLSGASQPHKHVQLLPLPIWEAAPAGETGDMTFTRQILACTANSAPWAAEELRSLPFASFVARLPGADEECSPVALAAAYAGLLQRCTEFAARQDFRLEEQGPAPLSYNMVLTRSFMMLVPRRAEADGPISCNSVAFAGSFFVRSTEELAYVRGTGPMHILSSVAFPWD